MLDRLTRLDLPTRKPPLPGIWRVRSAHQQHLENFPSGERERRLHEGERAAADAERDILDRLRRLPDGSAKAVQAEEKIRQLRAFTGYREYPKYALINRFASYKRALLAEAERLVRDGVIDDPSDIFMLTFDEAEEAIRRRQADRDLIARRRARLHADSLLRPPRVLTSDGEMFDGSYRREGGSPGALIGLGISRGAVEGRARVVHELGDADLRPGDILVTTHTDPSWTPAFVNASGLVTEVGGLTTHGAVVAREYGLVAVVGVEDAVTRIRDGQRIRIDGSRGTVELL